MTRAIATDRRANVCGRVLMIASMCAFAVEDVFIKAAAKLLPVGQVLSLNTSMLAGSALIVVSGFSSFGAAKRPDLSRIMALMPILENPAYYRMHLCAARSFSSERLNLLA